MFYIFYFLLFFFFVFQLKADLLDDVFRKISKTQEREALIYARNGDYEKARQILEPLFTDNQHSPQIVSEYILFTLRAGKNREAWNLYNNLANKEILHEDVKKELIENFVSSRHKNAVELARDGKHEEALKIIDECISLTPENPLLKADKILIKIWKGDENEALSEFEIEFSQKEAPQFLKYEIERLKSKFTANFAKERRLQSQIEKKNIHSFIQGEEKSNEDTKQEEINFIQKIVLNDSDKNDLINNGNTTEKAAGLSKLDAKIAEAEEYVKTRNLEKLATLAEELVRENPGNPNALIIMVYYYQLAKKHFKAYELNEKILQFSPGYMPSVNTKYHILLDIGAAQAAKIKMEESGDSPSAEVKKRILGDLSAEQIKFLAPKKALKMLEENISYANDYIEKNESVEAAKVFKRRAQFDKLLAMRQAEMMRDIVQNYEKLKEENVEIPYWALEAVGDAYLYLKKPERALKIYEQVHQYYVSQGLDKYPYNYNILMAKYFSLIELEKHNKAREILEDLDKNIPDFARPGGVFVENWDKFAVSIEGAWSLIYDDRLKEAEGYLEDLVASAPNNSNPRIAQAYLHLYREFPRLALEDFQIATNLDPESKAAAIGHAYALDLNDRSEEGREIAAKLLEKHPDDLGVIKLNRDFEIQDMRLLSVKANFSREGSFVDGAGYTIRLDQPIYPYRNIYAETLWLQTKDEFKRRNVFRSGIGFDWRLNRDFYVEGGFSFDHQGREPGISGGIRWDVDDHLKLAASYNSYSLNLPPKALLYKFKGQEAKFAATYRFSEDLITEASFSNIRLSDGNNNQNYTFRIDKGLSYSAVWKTRLAVEGYLTTNSKYKDREYYAPQYASSLYFVPMVEHMWFRRYDFSIFDRFYFGIGPHWEKGFKPEEVWYIRYEQEWRITDTFYFKTGGQYGKNKYGRDNTRGWNFYTEFYWNF